MNRVINNSLQPIVLKSGVTMAASGTDGSERTNVELSECDRKRYVRPDMLVVIETTVTTEGQPDPANGPPTQTGDNNKKKETK